MTAPWLPPEYRSSEWQQLTDDDPRKQQALVNAAECWYKLRQSPHVAELIADRFEWAARRDMSESTAEISELGKWKKLADTPTYAEIEQRRGDSSPIRRCDWKTCTRDGLPHRSPQAGAQLALCPAHAHHGVPEAVAVAEQHNERRAAA